MTETPLRLGLVGLGQIARVQHLPAIAANPDFRLVAIATRGQTDVPEGVALHSSMGEMIAAGGIDAVVLCTPPQMRYALVRDALLAGLHVFMEKPPTQTVAETQDLARIAAGTGRTLLASWHSMFSAAVAPARDILARRGMQAMRIDWQEDVHKFHPGVDWFWQPGGMGVFDPGVNALSIAVACAPEPLFVRAARFRVRPGEQTPVAADLAFATPSRETGFDAHFDWDHQGLERWTIRWTLDDGGVLDLSRGGGALALDGKTLLDEPDTEYPRLYAHFRDLVRSGRSDVEIRPLMLAADAFSLARRD
ncbi:Gfo/Idh/MocA family oxidoreductase [Acetobacteraceae bacterium KSS8]|uniref:Gfo/Idh/MocA family oxidoreductase n=1 Tax=Endosaccharibacter trunci TaxID=2812733 RepID=A0ABT1W615_9PROT|nr:Gfo/Idh/MocA family oxidoreductase [Acetobacteraceae bacterium KSS8]